MRKYYDASGNYTGSSQGSGARFAQAVGGFILLFILIAMIVGLASGH